MNVIGKEGVDIMGIGPSSLDTSILQLTDKRAAMSKSVSFNQKRRYTPSMAENGSRSSTIFPPDKPSPSCCSHCSLYELNALKKRKLELQIQLFEAQLARFDEE
ncbi:uncharacterized protein LOC127843173 [Dreissena polymorpha]|uniref:uncharacterized protein LOC127843173 n=1 Tax=Dreissena polymorpha TaxID=45954 RepID=UPI002264203B|nr:uncharacterized protein LOC127843173 [Dreissena polymorpha]